MCHNPWCSLSSSSKHFPTLRSLPDASSTSLAILHSPVITQPWSHSVPHTHGQIFLRKTLQHSILDWPPVINAVGSLPAYLVATLECIAAFSLCPRFLPLWIPRFPLPVSKAVWCSSTSTATTKDFYSEHFPELTAWLKWLLACAVYVLGKLNVKSNIVYCPSDHRVKCM